MKFASLKDGTRDGRPVLVARDHASALSIDDLAPSLLQIVEGWDHFVSELEQRYTLLNQSLASASFAFDPALALAPLRRAPQWLDASAFPTHGQRMVKAFNLSTKTLGLDYPLMYQGMSDNFLGAQTAMSIACEDDGIDIEGEVAVITADVPMAVTAKDAGRYIRLLTLLNDVSLRNLLFAEMSMGFGMIQCKPTCVFAPVAVTPDELGTAWLDERPAVTMTIEINGRHQGTLSGAEMEFSFGDLIAHAARTRTLSAGTIIGSGTFSNADQTRGTACISESRALEIIEQGVPISSWLKFGDRVHIEATDDQGRSLFGAIHHTFIAVGGAAEDPQ